MNEKGEKRKDYFDTCNVYYIPLLSIENVIWRNVSCRTACEKGMITDESKWKWNGMDRKCEVKRVREREEC